MAAAIATSQILLIATPLVHASLSCLENLSICFAKAFQLTTPTEKVRLSLANFREALALCSGHFPSSELCTSVRSRRSGRAPHIQIFAFSTLALALAIYAASREWQHAQTFERNLLATFLADPVESETKAIESVVEQCVE
jgi:hypothetical protein